uniref:Uncharacterized protein n=1 Tax=Rhizophora mucronata TaxID=61149 RepID=A0A2P2R268_RHIMU
MKKFAKPYIIQVATVMKPQYGKFIVVLKVCTIKIYQTVKDFVKAASAYHQQVQCILKDNKLTRPLATMELSWFLVCNL